MGNFCSHFCVPRVRGSVINLMKKMEPESKLERIARILQARTFVDNAPSKTYISRNVFIRYMFKRYNTFCNHIFDCITETKGDTSDQGQLISKDLFIERVRQNLLEISSEGQYVLYLGMYGDKDDYMTLLAFKEFLTLVYDIAMDYHPDGLQYCPDGENTIHAIIRSVFGPNDIVSVQDIDSWLKHNLPRLIEYIHNFVVYEFNSIRTVDRRPSPQLHASSTSSSRSRFSENIAELPLSYLWVLSMLLPNVFTCSSDHAKGFFRQSHANVFTNCRSNSYPTHWKLLYLSTHHGCSSNRFIYHVLNYEGPTAMFLKCDENYVFCVCTAEKWRQSRSYWGDESCYLVELSPRYYVIDMGPKMIYVNFNIYGYPFCIRVGTKTNNPSIILNDSLTMLTYRGILRSCNEIEVWACGSVSEFQTYRQKKRQDFFQESKP